jgi:ornithine cyclodeaminase/alanine dehydrogenase-like protein (mu-crystallin family)
MTLILSNEEIETVLTMEDLVPVLEDAYVELAEGRGGNRLRSDIVTPTTFRDDGLYALKSMDGVIPKFGVGAIRINSDILTFPKTGGKMRRVKARAAPGERYVGLVLLFSTHTGEPLLICPDGVMQRMRVGGTNALAAKIMARRDASVAAILGSGWQAGAQLLGLNAVRKLDEVRVYSPRKHRREVFAQEMSAAIGIAVRPCDTAAEACAGAHMVACSTNAVGPVFFREFVEPGMHVGGIRPGASEIDRGAWPAIDVFALLDRDDNATIVRTHGVSLGEEQEGGMYGMAHDAVHAGMATLPEIITGRREGRTTDGQVTCFLNNLGMGYQFAATGHLVFEKAKAAGLGRELPTDWFTETVHP